MVFTTKMSGTRVDDFDITPIFDKRLVWLSEVVRKIKKQETMDFILDNFRFSKGWDDREDDWYAILDRDTIYKISALENHPNEAQAFEERFGKNWINHYIRFNH